MKYSIIIPTYNHCDDLLKPCIESIFKHTDMTDIELIVSANGCTDNTKSYLDLLKHQFDLIGFSNHLKVIWNDAPLGYSKANNVALKEAKGEKIVLLNNDVILLGQEKNKWIEMLESAFENPKCGISCIIKGHSEPAGRDFAVFFCVMVHKKVFETIGPLNEEYGVGGGEDTEFCIEAEKAGFEVVQCSEKHWNGSMFVGQFPIYHHGEGTVHDPNLVKGWDSIFLQNSLKLAKKYNPMWFEAKMKDLELQNSKQSLAWICESGKEATEIFNEVVRDNIYQIYPENIKGRCVIDIGANIGTFSMLAANYGAAKVVAVEPVSSTYNTLLNNLSKAKVDNVVVPQKAVVLNEEGKKISIGLNDKCGHNSLYKSGNGQEEVSSVTLKNLLNMVDGDDVFLKIDCEGSEYDILMNMSKEDMDRISTLAIEVHLDLHPTYKGLEVIEEKIKSFGLKLVDRKQVGCWDLDSNGKMVNFRPLPLTNEIWVRQ